MHFTLLPASVLAALRIAYVNAAPLQNLEDFNARSEQRSLSSSLQNAVSWLCDLPRVDRICQKTSDIMDAWLDRSSVKSITTPLGRVQGVKSGDTYRYTLPYAQAPIGNLRFKPTVPISAWTGIYNASTLPPACPQSLLLSSSPSTNENCLFINIWVPATAVTTSNLPVFVWQHGGSFVAGSASDETLDGSVLASKGKMIVITMQYRLGIFGFLRSSSIGIAGNMAVLDAVEALSYVKRNIGSFGGNPSAVTLAGQSSGADLIKTLFSVPRADNLFQRAILHSAPLNYGDHSVATSQAVGQAFLSALHCTTLSCLQSANVTAVLDAQDNVFTSAPESIPGVSASEPIRPVIDGSIVTQAFFEFVNTPSLGNKNRQIIFTTVKEEAGPTIASVSQEKTIPADYYSTYVEALMDPDRASKVLNSGLYDIDTSQNDAARLELEVLGTDWVWRCANQQAALNLTMHGEQGRIWLAEFDVGIPYPSNSGIAFCKNKVCHQDDIQAVFSSGSNLSPSQTALEHEILTRWSAFAKTGSPNIPQYEMWPAVSAGTRLNMLVLRGTASTIVQVQREPQCGPNGFWGNRAAFDEVMYG